MNDFRDYNDYLMHYGIKGMHWGIRRYQPYPSGKTGIFKNLKEKKEERRKAYVEKNKQKILKNPKKVNKYYDYLSREEINKAREYKNFKREFGTKALHSIIITAATVAVTEFIKETTKSNTKNILNKMSNNEFVNPIKESMRKVFSEIKADALDTFKSVTTKQQKPFDPVNASFTEFADYYNLPKKVLNPFMEMSYTELMDLAMR